MSELSLDLSLILYLQVYMHLFIRCSRSYITLPFITYLSLIYLLIYKGFILFYNYFISCGWSIEKEDIPHVLAVDDNLIDRKLVEKLLKTSSCTVTTAENGMRALEYLGLRENQQQNNGNVTKVNMKITDYCMPGMTGYELLQKIKESSMLKDVPVVIMSLENVQTRINECLENGAQMFMLKPLKLSDVKKLRHQLAKC